MPSHPAINLLLVIGLIQFWLMPAIAWVLLKDQRDIAARFWFAGTSCYAGTATLFALQTVVPSALSAIAGLSLVILMLCLLIESLRREFQQTPTNWSLIVATVLGNIVVLGAVEQFLGLEAMRVTQLAIVSAVDIACCALLFKVINRYKSQALWFVLAGFSAVVITNIARMSSFILSGESPNLLTFSPISTIGFLVNYLSVVTYSFGYWGFVIEKNQARLLKEINERNRAEAGESLALDRERITLELLTERDELIAQLAKMQRVAQAGALSASIAHEINQPLASVRLSIEEAIEAQRSGAEPERLAWLLKRVAAENQRAAATIRTLREIFSDRNSSLEVKAMDDVVGAMCALVQRRAAEIKATVTTDLNAPVRVQLGAGELEHVVLNLLSNALDTLSGQNSSAPQVEVKTWTTDSSAFLRVQDNGSGVSPEMRGQLFELFAGSRPDGLGLGLWLTRHVVERHGGAITLDEMSDLSGASFTIQLAKLR